MHLAASTNNKSKALHLASKGDPQHQSGVWRWLVSWLAHRWGGIGMGSTRVGGPHMQVLETLSVGPRKQLILLRCAGETYLIGTGAESVQAIQRIESRPSDRSSVIPELGERS